MPKAKVPLTIGQQINPDKVSYTTSLPEVGVAVGIIEYQGGHIEISGINYGSCGFKALYSEAGYTLLHKPGCAAYTGRMYGTVYSKALYIAGYVFRGNHFIQGRGVDKGKFIFVFDLVQAPGLAWRQEKSRLLGMLQDMRERGAIQKVN